jgi:hypothetical protein
MVISGEAHLSDERLVERVNVEAHSTFWLNEKGDNT